MFDNVVLNVFIGLVLIYLLYSLFITILSEMIVTWMNLRARILRVSIEKMLNDGMHAKANAAKDTLARIWNIVERFFLKEFKDFKYSLAGKFYSAPSIKYLSDNGGEKRTAFTQTKPSYISADMFADTLIQLLKDKGVGATDIEKVNFCLQFNTHHIEPDSLKALRDHAEKAGVDINILKERFKAWFNETQDRATGWYKKKVQFILFWLGLIIAIIFNVDSIQIAKILSKDKEARNQLANMAVAFSKDSTKYADFIDSNGDTVHPKAILDSGFKHVSKDISDANMVLGLGWPLSNLVKDDTKSFDTIGDKAVYLLLNKYKPVFNKFNDATNELKDSIVSGIDNINSLNQQLVNYESDTNILNLQLLADSIIGKNDSIKKANLHLTKKASDSIVNKLSIAQTKLKTDSAKLYLMLQRKKEAVAAVNKSASLKFQSIDYVTDDTVWYYARGKDTLEDPSPLVNQGQLSKFMKSKVITIHTLRPYTTSEKFWYVISNYHPFTICFWSFIFSIQFIGLFITALMLSLGAPFWFDLLKKLVALRGAGVKPEEKKEEAKKDQQTILAQKDAVAVKKQTEEKANLTFKDNIEEAISKVSKQLYEIPGIKAIIRGNNGTNDFVQFNVADKITADFVNNNFKSIKIHDGIEVPGIAVETGIPKAHARFGQIMNETGIMGVGTLGCIVKDADTNQLHMLSCWHVMKGDEALDKDDGFTKIRNNQNEYIADRWGGGIYDCFDYGFALCNEGVDLNNNFIRTELGITEPNVKIKPVTDYEIKKKPAIKLYDYLKSQKTEGIIYSGGFPVEVDYDTGTTFFINDVIVLTNNSGAVHTTLSDHGNSGTLVFDNENNAIAMIIAGDSHYSYAVRLSKIFALYPTFQII